MKWSTRKRLTGRELSSFGAREFRKLKRDGIGDRQISERLSVEPMAVREARKKLGVEAVFNRVDTCAAEFESFTPYMYSSYESENEAAPSNRKKVMILGSGPNRIGQGIEFDYCCCHASFALQDFGVESIMVNCNPETVSTDYDTSDRLYFEPLTQEEVLNIYDVEKPDGLIVQFGGQTPLNLAMPLKELGLPIIGTDPSSIDLAEDRKLFGKLLSDLNIPSPPHGTATNVAEAIEVAGRLGFPVLVRPSYVLGGRNMVIAYNEETVRRYMQEATNLSVKRPVLIDRFLEDATEVDVDALCDGQNVLIAGIMEHIEEAASPFGDSSCVLPPFTSTTKPRRPSKTTPPNWRGALNVIGLMNVQYAMKNGDVYVLEVNPRASRTVPFVSKATGVPLPKIAVGLMLGKNSTNSNPSPVALSTAPCRFTISSSKPGLPVQQVSRRRPGPGPRAAFQGEVMGVGVLRRSLR